MPTFRRRSPTVEAMQYVPTKAGIAALLRFCPFLVILGKHPALRTKKTMQPLHPGEWLVREYDGTFARYTPQHFEATYVTEEPPHD